MKELKWFILFGKIVEILLYAFLLFVEYTVPGKQLSHFHVYHLDIWRSTLNEKNWLLLSLLSSLRPDMTEILLKRTLNRKPSVNPSTSPKKL